MRNALGFGRAPRFGAFGDPTSTLLTALPLTGANSGPVIELFLNGYTSSGGNWAPYDPTASKVNDLAAAIGDQALATNSAMTSAVNAAMNAGNALVAAYDASTRSSSQSKANDALGLFPPFANALDAILQVYSTAGGQATSTSYAPGAPTCGPGMELVNGVCVPLPKFTAFPMMSPAMLSNLEVIGGPAPAPATPPPSSSRKWIFIGGVVILAAGAVYLVVRHRRKVKRR